MLLERKQRLDEGKYFIVNSFHTALKFLKLQSLSLISKFQTLATVAHDHTWRKKHKIFYEC